MSPKGTSRRANDSPDLLPRVTMQSGMPLVQTAPIWWVGQHRLLAKGNTIRVARIIIKGRGKAIIPAWRSERVKEVDTCHQSIYYVCNSSSLTICIGAQKYLWVCWLSWYRTNSRWLIICILSLAFITPLQLKRFLLQRSSHPYKLSMRVSTLYVEKCQVHKFRGWKTPIYISGKHTIGVF